MAKLEQQSWGRRRFWLSSAHSKQEAFLTAWLATQSPACRAAAVRCPVLEGQGWARLAGGTTALTMWRMQAWDPWWPPPQLAVSLLLSRPEPGAGLCCLHPSPEDSSLLAACLFDAWRWRCWGWETGVDLWEPQSSGPVRCPSVTQASSHFVPEVAETKEQGKETSEPRPFFLCWRWSRGFAHQGRHSSPSCTPAVAVFVHREGRRAGLLWSFLLVGTDCLLLKDSAYFLPAKVSFSTRDFMSYS